jgi:hypothetical protein
LDFQFQRTREVTLRLNLKLPESWAIVELKKVGRIPGWFRNVESGDGIKRSAD